jgi:hypothetical protein
MKRTLNEIFILESDQKFDETFSLYKTILKSETLNFEYWKHNFFFFGQCLRMGLKFSIISYNTI